MQKICALLIAFAVWGDSLRAQQLSATLDYARFQRGDSTLVAMLLSFDGTSMHYALGPDSLLHGQVSALLTLADSTGALRYADRFTLTPPPLAHLGESQVMVSAERNLLVAPGRYTMRVEATDLHDTTARPISTEAPIEALRKPNGPHFSDVRLLRVGTTQGRHGAFYSAADTVLRAYAELYGTATALGDSTPFLIRFKITDSQRRVLPGYGRFARHRAHPTEIVLTDLNISTLPSGNYLLLTEALDREGNLLTQAWRYFQRSNPAVARRARVADPSLAADLSDAEVLYLLPSLFPLATETESGAIEQLVAQGTPDQRRAYLREFWEDRSPTPARALAEYRERVAIAEESYAVQTLRAHETDRGRVYLQYGKPNFIENERNYQRRSATDHGQVTPFEVWHYPHIEQLNQTNRVFVFVQENLANYNYRLIHSNAIGEFSNPEWQQNLFNANPNLDFRDPGSRDNALFPLR